MSKIIFGGTFDPLHLGHLILANYALWETKAEGVIFVPAGRYPDKENAQISNQDRLAMLQLALQDEKWASICSYEIEQVEKGVQYSYTYDTVQYLKEQGLVEGKPYLLMGDDHVCFSTWYKAKELSNEVTLLMAHRYFSGGVFPYPHSQLRNRVVELSSSFIRDLVKRNEPYKWYLHDKVYNYIQERKLYL